MRISAFTLAVTEIRYFRSSATVESTNNIRTSVDNVVNHPQFRSLSTDVVGCESVLNQSSNNRTHSSRTNNNE